MKSQVVERLIRKHFGTTEMENILLNIRLQSELFGDLNASLPLYYHKFDDGSMGIYTGKDKIYGGVNLKF